MAHRLSKITTRTGDAGQTGLGDGSRVSKHHGRVQALGDVDELNSAIGLVLAEDVPPAVRTALSQVQQDLFDLGGELSIPGHALLAPTQVTFLDQHLESSERRSSHRSRSSSSRAAREAAAAAHLARTICRRAGRSLVSLGQEKKNQRTGARGI
jgi:cob(I)alamin adenosyltransferase